MVDPTTGAIVTILYEQYKLGQGESFKVDDVLTVDTTTQKWMITTPDSNVYARMLFETLCTGEHSINVTEGADRTGTTLLPVINRNRVGTPASATVLVHRDVSGGTTDGATTIKQAWIGVTDKFSGLSSESLGRRGYMKPNTKYVVAIETFSAVHISLRLHWYEHVDKSWFNRIKA